MRPPHLAPSFCRIAALTVLFGCGTASPSEDAGSPDAGFEDAGTDAGTDAAPACADFSGAYRTEMLLDPCLANTPFQYGPLCVAQVGCAVTLLGTHGEVTGTAGSDALSFETEFLQCSARREGDQLRITCEDSEFMTSCSVDADPAPALAGVCCTGDDDCDGSDRCAPVTLGAPSPVPVASACVPTGAGALGGACTTSGGVGDCGSGLTCTSGGLGDDAVECRLACRGAGDCPGDERCVWYSLTAPTIGFCMQTCTLYGDECPSGATCDGVTTLADDGSLSDGLACRGSGGIAPGAACERSEACTVNHRCSRPPGGGDFRCRPICGPDTPCESSEDRCQLIGTDTAVAGACVPR